MIDSVHAHDRDIVSNWDGPTLAELKAEVDPTRAEGKRAGYMLQHVDRTQSTP